MGWRDNMRAITIKTKSGLSDTIEIPHYEDTIDADNVSALVEGVYLLTVTIRTRMTYTNISTMIANTSWI